MNAHTLHLMTKANAAQLSGYPAFAKAIFGLIKKDEQTEPLAVRHERMRCRADLDSTPQRTFMARLHAQTHPITKKPMGAALTHPTRNEGEKKV